MAKSFIKASFKIAEPFSIFIIEKFLLPIRSVNSCFILSYKSDLISQLKSKANITTGNKLIFELINGISFKIIFLSFLSVFEYFFLLYFLLNIFSF